MKNNNEYIPSEYDEDEDELQIDWAALLAKAWKGRKFIAVVALIAALIGVVFALTSRKVYTVNVTLAPEVTGTSGGSLGGIASMMGLGNMNMGSEGDALGITLYPDIVSSTPFLTDLFGIQVKDIDNKTDTTLYAYMECENGFSIGSVIGAVAGLFSKEEEDKENGKVNSFYLSKKQDAVVQALRKSVVADVDNKTGKTTVSVTMDDPLVAATLADSVCARLQEHITVYRISKAKEDYEYYQKMTKESKDAYTKAQHAYAEYQDRNRGLILQTVLSEQTRLQNEVQLAYQVYSQMAQQMEMAKAKVQEAKPVFAVVEPATVPLKPSGVSRKIVVLGFLFLGFAGALAWVLYGRDFLAKAKEGLKEAKQQEQVVEDSNVLKE